MTQFSSCCKEVILIHISYIEKLRPRVSKFDSVSNCHEMKTQAYNLVSFLFNVTPQTCDHYSQSRHGHMGTSVRSQVSQSRPQHRDWLCGKRSQSEFPGGIRGPVFLGDNRNISVVIILNKLPLLCRNTAQSGWGLCSSRFALFMLSSPGPPKQWDHSNIFWMGF